MFLGGGLSGGRDAGDDLDFEIEAGKPGGADRGPGGIGLGVEVAGFGGHDSVELVRWIGVEGGDIDDVIKGAAGGGEDGFEVLEGELNLLGEIGLGGAIDLSADLARDEEEILGANGGGIAVGFVKGGAIGGEDGIAFGHGGHLMLFDVSIAI